MNAKDRISKGLKEIGAAWATSTRKYTCANRACCRPLEGTRPAYHIHPDASEPWENAIRRFTSLDAIAEYIDVRKRMLAATSEDEAIEIWDDYNAS